MLKTQELIDAKKLRKNLKDYKISHYGKIYVSWGAVLECIRASRPDKPAVKL